LVTGNRKVFYGNQNFLKKGEVVAETERYATSSRNNQLRNMASPIEKSTAFLSEVVTEMKKVTWPDRKQTMASTLVVIVFTVVVSIYLFGVDALVHWLINMLLR
jgi:preprotein translocase subunit SecE